MNLRRILFLPSALAACVAAVTLGLSAPRASAIPHHKGGGKPHGGGRGHGGKPHGGAPHGHPGGPPHRAGPPHGHPAPHRSAHHGPPPPRGPRHGYHGLPRGARPYSYGGYRYYREGGRFFYPYFYGGRIVYIDIDAPGGVPVPPPPAGSIEIHF